jgi:CDP-glucose 4,6-dehydratase
MVINTSFWKNKSIFITGHTGFKGSWLTLWLQALGAHVTGFSLPEAEESLFKVAHVNHGISHIIGDIRDSEALQKAINTAAPEIVFHLAAQSLVRYSYAHPALTYSTNVIGTVNLLDAIRQQKSVKAIVNVTSDKCYENKEWSWGYRESDRLGGFDPYSNSKARSELVTEAYRRSFFSTNDSTRLASARAGNVIGGGDWSPDRLIPDLMRAYLNQIPLELRYPHAERPWQYVLEPLSGYLLLAEKLYDQEIEMASAWNFGPNESDVKSVQWIVNAMQRLFDQKITVSINSTGIHHEATYLKLDCSKAKAKLKWKPTWGLEKGLKETSDWYKAFKQKKDMRSFTLQQLSCFMEI